jgi:pyruvate/2-oxoglutarate dehydrogenase complex dihydrolipoamide dehydrogenase (E3) component/uncharacterized membrane protein YdjX (TVP38/TMEM64 family)
MASTTQQENKSRKQKLALKWKIVMGITFAALLVAAAQFFHVQDLLSAALDWIRGLGALGPVIFVATYILASVFFLPGSVLTLGAGALFGVVRGSIVVSIAATLGAACAFLAGRYLARGWVERKIEGNEKFKAMDETVAREGWKIVGLTRLSPIFPFNLLNYAYGITNVSLRDYFFASWIGMLPGTIMYVYIGSLAGDLATLGTAGGSATTAQWALRVVGLLATVAVTVYITRIARGALQEKVDGKGRFPVDQVIAAESAWKKNEEVPVPPMDKHNQKLVSNVHPRDWVNPEPDGRYNLVVIGAGTAGLVTAAGAAGLGAKVALVEKHLIGGDCLNVGCVPSKCVIRSSRALMDVKEAHRFGVRVPGEAEPDFAAVMERMRRLRAGISDHDSAGRFRDLGVDVFLGEARFSGPDTVEVAGKALRFKKAVITTGARAVAPPIEGLAEAGYLTNETVFNLTEGPRRVACIGGGPIGSELAQAFHRLGCEVKLLHSGSHILNREDPDAAEIVQQAFLREGIHLILNCTIKRVERRGGGKVVSFESNGKSGSVTVDEILVGAGRAPNVDGLNLEAVGVTFDPTRGIEVNERLQTTNPRIYAAGDVCMQWKFTHAADAAARIVLQNSLFFGRKKLGTLTMPWCTYTDPEIAHVGMYEAEAKAKGIETESYKIDMVDNDRAVADGETEGFVKITVRKGSDAIIGATIMAAHAGDLISEVSVAMAGKVGLKAMNGIIHPYPTQADAIKRAAGAYNRTRLTPRVAALLRWLLRRQL